MTQQTVTGEELVTIVRALANGMSLQQVTADSDLPYEEVARIAKANGYPNRNALAQSAHRLEHQKPFAGASETGRPFGSTALGELLAKAREIGLGAKADRIVKLARDLDTEVKEKAALAEAMAELRKAQEKVAALRGTAKPKTDPVTLTRAESKAVREWAAANGHDVGKSGRIPATVVVAYREAVQA